MSSLKLSSGPGWSSTSPDLTITSSRLQASTWREWQRLKEIWGLWNVWEIRGLPGLRCFFWIRDPMILESRTLLISTQSIITNAEHLLDFVNSDRRIEFPYWELELVSKPELFEKPLLGPNFKKRNRNGLFTSLFMFRGDHLSSEVLEDWFRPFLVLSKDFRLTQNDDRSFKTLTQSFFTKLLTVFLEKRHFSFAVVTSRKNSCCRVSCSRATKDKVDRGCVPT